MTDADRPVDADDDASQAEEGTGTPTRHGVPVLEGLDMEVLFPPRDRYVEVVQALYDEGYRFCSDVTAVDYLTHPGRTLPAGVEPERFEVVVELLSHELRRRVRVKVQVPAHDAVVPTLWSIHPGSEALEREAFDMFGVRFDGHPDLTRILMPEDWEGHPLRKDHAVGRVPVQFKGVPPPR